MRSEKATNRDARLRESVMPETISLELPGNLVGPLDQLALREGVSRGEVIVRAIEEHLFLREFRDLRDRLSKRAEGQGIVSDQDVFDRVS